MVGGGGRGPWAQYSWQEHMQKPLHRLAELFLTLPGHIQTDIVRGHTG